MDLPTIAQYRTQSRTVYVCPTCNRNLADGTCGDCGFTVDLSDEIPSFFSGSELANRYREIARFYDSEYQSDEHVVWAPMRGPEFIAYVESLVRHTNPTRYLDIGCGQGRLLGAISALEKHGIDISPRAVAAARLRAGGSALCLGIVEELPYPANYFDVVTGIGVMHHFLDGPAAMHEVWRVLREGGTFIVNPYIATPLFERFLIKISEFIYPRFRPVRLSQWAFGKYRRAPALEAQKVQPVYNPYTARQVRRFFRRSGFRVTSLITKRGMPDAPLAAHHFRIYVLQKTLSGGTCRRKEAGRLP